MMKVPFVDLYAQYLNLKPAIDAAIEEVISDQRVYSRPTRDRVRKRLGENARQSNIASLARTELMRFISRCVVSG